MGVLAPRQEQRSLSFQSFWGQGGETAEYRADSARQALRLVPVYAATALIADQICASPWAVFEKTGNVPTQASSQPALVENPAVGGLDLFSWRHQAMSSVLLGGNADGIILDTDSRGVPSQILWARPAEIEIDESASNGIAVFYYKGRQMDRSDIIHVPGYVIPGYQKGLSPIGLFRLQIETGMKAQVYGDKFFKRGTVPPGVLKNVNAILDPTNSADAKARFMASVSSSEPFVTGKDWDYTAIAIPPGDAQFLAGINATAIQIAAAYRVAPDDVGGESTSKKMTYASLEMDQLKFAIRTLRPWAERFESVFNRYLPVNQYVKTNLDSTVRADIQTRYAAHQVAIGAGFETIDEARALEDSPPLTPDQLALYQKISLPNKPLIPS